MIKYINPINIYPKNKTIFIKNLICLSIFILGTTAISKPGSEHANHLSIGIEIASWKPSVLDEKPTALFEGVPGATPGYGAFFVSPWLGNLALRVAIMQWCQSDIRQKADVERVRLRPLSVDLKNRILGGTALSPYVCYGALFIWAAERPEGTKKFAEDKSQFGYGGSVGAGLDVVFSRRWALGLEFQYLYVKLANHVGLTDDYSGPKISAKIFYMF